jgi:transposase InsO family protein
MALTFLYRAFCRILQILRRLGRDRTELAVEVVMLRHEVMVLRRQISRPSLQPADRAILSGLARLVSRARRHGILVQPETLLRWHRDLVKRHWTYSKRPGRPSLPAGTVALICRLATKNPTWGYRRIHGELATMGITVGASTVWSVLKRHGIDPTPRRTGPTWQEFLKAQASTMVACDFFHVDTVLFRRFYVLVFMDLHSRVVHLAGITTNPVADWVTQQARNLSFGWTDRIPSTKYLIRDRDCKFTSSFDEVFRSEGIRIVKTPVRAPRANAICERVIGTLRRECLDRVLILGSRHLESVLVEFIEHYNEHRPHCSLTERCPRSWDSDPAPVIDPQLAHLRRADRLGGLIHEYRIAA